MTIGDLWDWAFVLEILPDLLRGLRTSVIAAVLGFLVAASAGLPLALLRRSTRSWPRRAASAVIEFIRGTPLLVQLFFLFYVIPKWGVTLSPMVTGVLGLGLYYSAYAAEVYRGGLEAVPAGQWEASLALNFSRFRTLKAIILPQALPPIIPALGNYLIYAFKQSSLLAAITVLELVQTASLIASRTFHYVEPLTMVGVFYLAVSYPAAILIRRVEARYGTT